MPGVQCAGIYQAQHGAAKDNTVDHKGQKAVGADILHQQADCGQADKECEDSAFHLLPGDGGVIDVSIA